MGLRPIGSEKLKGQDKINRIMEIANYKSNTESTIDAGVEYSIEASNNKVYGITRENSNYIIKEGDSLDNLGYLNGMRNSRKETFRSYSAALKKLNLIINEINSSTGNEGGLSLYGEQEKFTLKMPDTAEPEEEMDMDLGSDDMDFDMGDEEGEDVDMDVDVDDEDMDMDMDVDVDMGDEEGDTTIKSIQKLTGKLGQKLRDLKDEMEGDDIKYVINSIISAVDLEKLSEDDVEDILSKFEDEEIDYSEEGEFELDSDGDEEFDMDMDVEDEGGDEELDIEMGEAENNIDEFWGGLAKAGAVAAIKSFSESTNPVDKTIKKYFKESKSEKSNKKQLIKEFINKKISNNTNNKKVSKYYLSYEQEVMSNKLMEKYSVNFKGRNKQGDLLFTNENIKVGITKEGKIIK
tara:strand:+ start:4071 stop:5288 length:1218 start_codon:yes stop_codon:yes gene_type:complete